MEKSRIFDIVSKKNLCDVYYDERPVWIQEVKDNIAKVAFVDNNEEKNVYIEDLYESGLYNDGRS